MHFCCFENFSAVCYDIKFPFNNKSEQVSVYLEVKYQTYYYLNLTNDDPGRQN